MTNEAARLAESLSSVTHAPFKVSEPPISRKEPRSRAEWFVWCPDLAYGREAGHLKYAWKDNDGTYWFESSDISNSAKLVELEYGERRVDELKNLDLSKFGDARARNEFARKFPLVERRFREWQKILNLVAQKRGVHLELRFDALKRIVVFMIGAKTSPTGTPSEIKRSQIEVVEKALREAYNLVSKVKT